MEPWDLAPACVSDLPLPVQHQIFGHAWLFARSKQQRHALYCCCRTARDALVTLISSLEVKAPQGAVLAAVVQAARQGVPKGAGLQRLAVTGVQGEIEMREIGQAPGAGPGGGGAEADAAGPASMASVVSLQLVDTVMTFSQLEQLASYCPLVQKLSVSEPVKFWLEPWSYLPDLTSLEVDAQRMFTVPLLKDVAQMTALRRLKLTLGSGCSLTSVAQAAAAMTRLERLNASFPELNGVDLAQTQGLTHLSSLRSLQLRHSTAMLRPGLMGLPWDVQTVTEMLLRNPDQLPAMTQLTSLSLPDDVPMAADIIRFFSMPGLQHLEVAAFFGNVPSAPPGFPPPACALKSLTLTLPHFMHYGSADFLPLLTHLTCLTVRGQLAEGAAELALGLPQLQVLRAGRLVPDSGWRQQGPGAMRPRPQLRLPWQLDAAAGELCSLRRVVLGEGSDPAELLLLPSSVAYVELGRVQWKATRPARASTGHDDHYSEPGDVAVGGPRAVQEAAALEQRPSAHLDEIGRAARFLLERWYCGSEARDLVLVTEPGSPQAVLPLLPVLRGSLPEGRRVVLTLSGLDVDGALLQALLLELGPSLHCLRLMHGRLEVGAWGALAAAPQLPAYLAAIDMVEDESAGVVSFVSSCAGRDVELAISSEATPSQPLVDCLTELLSLVDGAKMKACLYDEDSFYVRNMHVIRVTIKSSELE